MRERRTLYRLPPCPAYDVEGTESWLGDMAKEGWHLAADGIWCGVARFERGEPRTVRYRLAAAKESTSMWSDGGDRPDSEQVETGAALGWEYVGNRGEFHIFRAADSAALEMDTDPRVQALALEAVRKRQRSNLFNLAVYPAAVFLFNSRGNLFLAAVNVGSGLILTLLTVMLCSLIGNLREYFTLRALKKRLEAGESLDHSKDWRSRKGRYLGGRAAGWMVLLLLAIVIARAFMVDVRDEIPLAEYPGHPPFATVRDLTEEWAVRYETAGNNYAKEWSDLLFPVNLNWNEFAMAAAADGGDMLNASLLVDYHEAVSPWAARLLALDYHRWDRWGSRWNRERYEQLDCPDLDVDWAVAYNLVFTTVVLQKGNVVVRAQFPQGRSLAEWAPKLAASIS